MSSTELSDKPKVKRRWLQFRLSTAILAMFLAGGAIWMNLVNYKTPAVAVAQALGHVYHFDYAGDIQATEAYLNNFQHAQKEVQAALDNVQSLVVNDVHDNKLGWPFHYKILSQSYDGKSEIRNKGDDRFITIDISQANDGVALDYISTSPTAEFRTTFSLSLNKTEKWNLLCLGANVLVASLLIGIAAVGFELLIAKRLS